MAGETTDTTMMGRTESRIAEVERRLSRIEHALGAAFTVHLCAAKDEKGRCGFCALYEFLNR